MPVFPGYCSLSHCSLSMATHSFADWFTYKTYERTRKGKVFYDCVLLKDFGFKYIHKGSNITDIMIDSILKMIWVPCPGSGNKVYEYQYINIPTPHSSVLMTDITDPLHVIEDRLGIVMHTGSFFDVISDARDMLYDHYDNACKVIQGRWRMCVSNPDYKVCRDRLMREFSEIF